jgi:hypothetical protein
MPQLEILVSHCIFAVNAADVILEFLGEGSEEIGRLGISVVFFRRDIGYDAATE